MFVQCMRVPVHTHMHTHTGLLVPRTLKLHQKQMLLDSPEKHALPLHTPIPCVPSLLWGESASQTDTAPLTMAGTHFLGIEKGRHLTTLPPMVMILNNGHTDRNLIIQCPHPTPVSPE